MCVHFDPGKQGNCQQLGAQCALLSGHLSRLQLNSHNDATDTLSNRPASITPLRSIYKAWEFHTMAMLTAAAQAAAHHWFASPQQCTFPHTGGLRDVQDEAKEKALHSFCEEVRLRGKVVCRTAICDDDRKEFFRGKDLLRYCEANPEKLEGLADTSARFDRRTLLHAQHSAPCTYIAVQYIVRTKCSCTNVDSSLDYAKRKHS